MPVQRPAPPTDNRGARAFTGGRRLHAETAVSSDSLLGIDHWWSDQHHLDLNTVCLSSGSGFFFPFSFFFKFYFILNFT